MAQEISSLIRVKLEPKSFALSHFNFQQSPDPFVETATVILSSGFHDLQQSLETVEHFRLLFLLIHILEAL